MGMSETWVRHKLVPLTKLSRLTMVVYWALRRSTGVEYAVDANAIARNCNTQAMRLNPILVLQDKGVVIIHWDQVPINFDSTPISISVEDKLFALKGLEVPVTP